MDIEQHNRREIDRLNQRGGWALSIVDLIHTGTIRIEMAACAMRAMHQGASLLTRGSAGRGEQDHGPGGLAWLLAS